MVPAGPDTIRPRRALMGMAVEQNQPPAAVHHVAQRGGCHRAQSGVVVQAQLVVGEPLGLAQLDPPLPIQQLGGKLVGGCECAPAGQGGQLTLSVAVRIGAGAGGLMVTTAWPPR